MSPFFTGEPSNILVYLSTLVALSEQNPFFTLINGSPISFFLSSSYLLSFSSFSNRSSSTLAIFSISSTYGWLKMSFFLKYLAKSSFPLFTGLSLSDCLTWIYRAFSSWYGYLIMSAMSYGPGCLAIFIRYSFVFTNNEENFWGEKFLLRDN